MWREMELREIQMKESGESSQIVVLGEKGGKREFPIYIGQFEVQTMYLAIHGHQPQRPMTHDLIFNIIEGFDARLVGICVDDLRDGTFHGKLMLEKKDGQQLLIDTRPSDAIVLAVKQQTPIYVDDRVLEAVDKPPQSPPEEESGF